MGQLLGSAISGLSTDAFGWRSPLYISSGIALVATAAIAMLLLLIYWFSSYCRNRGCRARFPGPLNCWYDQRRA